MCAGAVVVDKAVAGGGGSGGGIRSSDVLRFHVPSIAVIVSSAASRQLGTGTERAS